MAWRGDIFRQARADWGIRLVPCRWTAAALAAVTLYQRSPTDGGHHEIKSHFLLNREHGVLSILSFLRLNFIR